MPGRDRGRDDPPDDGTSGETAQWPGARVAMGKPSTCFVCGKDSDSTGQGAAPACVDGKTVLLSAHPRCFCLHQIYKVVTTDEEDKCDKGSWVIDWKADVPKYVKAEQLDAVQLALTEANVSSAAKSFNPGQKAKAQSGMAQLAKAAGQAFSIFAQALA